MSLKPLVITMGDAAGIGPEIVARAFAAAQAEGCVVIGDLGVMRRAITLQPEWARPVAVIDDPLDLAVVPVGALPLIVPAALPAALHEVRWGRIDARCGAAAARCIETAVRFVQAGRAGGIVTAPVHKGALAAAGIGFPGHTEMLQSLAGAADVRMMLANDELRVVLVTIHMSVRQALAALSFDAVLETIRITQRSLVPFGIAAPRIAVAGLNPHAGEGGLFGDEEIRFIAPAVQAARSEGIDASGPFAPDTVFMRARHSAEHPGEFDAVVAMLHDQGLIPVKYLGVEQGVNVTLGLPFVRTSPDHGTAFDIAGQGVADVSSLVAAIRMARRLTAV